MPLKHNIATFTCITAMAASWIIFQETEFPWVVPGAILLLYIALIAYGSLNIRANYFLKSIHRGKKKSVALTFDDGPDPKNTPVILNILRQKNLRATFFVIGKKAEQYPEILRRIHEEGHIIGNHTYSHHYLLGFFSKTRLKADIQHCNDVIMAATGKMPLFFRPPFGVTNPRYASVIKDLHINSIGWSLRSLDTRAKNKYQLINKIIENLKARDIVLLHDHLEVTADSLEDVIEHCLQKGTKIIPLSELIQKEPYVEK